MNNLVDKNWILRHPTTGKTVVEINNGIVIFQSKVMEEALQITGISIPHLQKSHYGDKSTIFPGDKLFAKAFCEIYYPLCLKESGFSLISY